MSDRDRCLDRQGLVARGSCMPASRTICRPASRAWLGRPRLGRLRMPKSYLRRRLAVLHRHEHVRRLEVAMDDASDAHCHGAADVDHERDAFGIGRRITSQNCVSGSPWTSPSRRKAAGVGGAAVEYARNARVIHHRERLPLGLEPRDEVARIHAELDHLSATRRATGCRCSEGRRCPYRLRRAAESAYRDRFARQ